MRHWPLAWNPIASEFDGPEACAEADFILFFGNRTNVSVPSLFQSLRRLCPSARIIGCSTGTAISGPDLDDDAPVATAVKLDNARVEMASASVGVLSSFHDGQALARQLSPHGLTGILILSDGLHVNGSALVAGVQSIAGVSVPLGGGLAGDGAAFEKTLVSADAPPQENIAVALGFYGEGVQINTGAAHGWDFFGPIRRITRSDGAVLYEMDGKPALDLYERYLGEEAADLPASALLYPLLIANPNAPSEAVVRTVLAVDRAARTMTFAGDMPQGWNARLMRGAFDNLAAGAASAAYRARGSGARSGLALLVSCVGRRLLMGQRAADEVEAVADALGADFHRLGFYSYGEISTQHAAGWCGLHNQTMTVMTLSEAA